MVSTPSPSTLTPYLRGYSIDRFYVAAALLTDDADVPDNDMVLVPNPLGQDPDQTRLVLVIEVDDVNVTVNVSPTGDDYPDLDLTLTFPNTNSPDDTYPLPHVQPDAGDGVYTFSAPPRRDPYRITVTDSLHTQQGIPQTVLVHPPGTDSIVDVGMTANLYRLKGNLLFGQRGGGSDPIPYARVTVYQGSTTSVTIANIGSAATVTDNDHGLSTNDKVRIDGASHLANNGVHTITSTTLNTYTYTMGSAPGSSPTGTITSTNILAGPVNVTSAEFNRYEFDLATPGLVRIEVVKLDSTLVVDPLYGPKSITFTAARGKVYDNSITVLGNVALTGRVANGSSGAPNAPVTAPEPAPQL